jgi:hypothetical protein
MKRYGKDFPKIFSEIKKDVAKCVESILKSK